MRRKRDNEERLARREEDDRIQKERLQRAVEMEHMEQERKEEIVPDPVLIISVPSPTFQGMEKTLTRKRHRVSGQKKESNSNRQEKKGVGGKSVPRCGKPRKSSMGKRKRTRKKEVHLDSFGWKNKWYSVVLLASLVCYVSSFFFTGLSSSSTDVEFLKNRSAMDLKFTPVCMNLSSRESRVSHGNLESWFFEEKPNAHVKIKKQPLLITTHHSSFTISRLIFSFNTSHLKNWQLISTSLKNYFSLHLSASLHL